MKSLPLLVVIAVGAALIAILLTIYVGFLWAYLLLVLTFWLLVWLNAQQEKREG
ncbi:hypothetical protein [Spirosoma luteolum]